MQSSLSRNLQTNDLNHLDKPASATETATTAARWSHLLRSPKASSRRSCFSKYKHTQKWILHQKILFVIFWNCKTRFACMRNKWKWMRGETNRRQNGKFHANFWYTPRTRATIKLSAPAYTAQWVLENVIHFATLVEGYSNQMRCDVIDHSNRSRDRAVIWGTRK